MRIRTHDGRVFQGTALQIVQQMQSMSMHAGLPLRDYVAEVVVRAAEADEAYVHPEGATDEQLAESLVEELLRVKLARQL